MNDAPPLKLWPRRRWVLILVLAGLVALYVHGTFDHALSGIGLNYHECARNGFGATFCGKELDEYRERVQQVTP